MNGKGTFNWANRQIFKGYYKNDQKYGNGKMILEDGTKIEGYWQNGKMKGAVIMTNSAGIVKKVRWKESKGQR